MRRQHGFVIAGWMYIVGAIVILAMVAGLIAWADRNIETTAGVKKGEANINAKWTIANKDAQDKADKDKADRAKEIEKQARILDAANATASDYYAQWRDANARNRKPLVVCAPSKVVSHAPSAVPDAGGGVRLTADFVRKYDTAWTGRDSKPVFGDTVVAPDEAIGTATVENALRVHGENAERCSKARRDYNALIDTILKLRGD